jgi:PAS domain S-box-containing protein
MKSEARNARLRPEEPTSVHQEIALLKSSVTEKQQIIDALCKSEAYFRAITQNASDLIIVSDRIGNITYVNTPIERILGYQPDELIGKSCFSYILPADIPRAIYDYGKAILTRDELISNSFRVRHKDGSDRTLEGVGHNLLDDPVVGGFVMNVHDVTQRKQAEAELGLYQKQLEELVKERTSELAEANARLRVELAERRKMEEALRASEALYRALIQQSTDIISILDSQGRFVYNSPAAESTLGYPTEEIVGKAAFDFIHPDDLTRVIKRFGEVLAQINPGMMIELRFRKSDGSWRYLECRGNNLLEYPGINGIVITSRDMTERKQAEEEHRLLEGRLNQAHKMESLGTLAGGVAHDLNNVLGVLVGYSELLLREIPVENPSHRRVSHILQSSLKAAAIIEDLLVLARRGVKVSEVVQLNNIVSDFLKTPEFEKLRTYHPHVRFKSDLARDLLHIQGSPVHLEKTVMNLVSNAAEAIISGGEVEMRTRNVHLDAPVRGYDAVREGDYVLLTVSDSGSGISAADIEKIFEPFYTKKVMGRSGTGLGLAVVWGTVKDHEGYIDIESEDGKGSTFSIFIPATREALTGSRPEIAPEEYLGEGESILIVDDVQEQREVAKSMLTTLRYRVYAVSSGEEAIAYLKDHAADLLVLDMIMDPGIDGLETYRRVLESRPGQKAVIVSGFSETDRIHEAQRLGASAYVRKPYTLEKIGLALRQALQPQPDGKR